MRQQLKEALLARFPDMKGALAERYVEKYASAVMQEVARQYMHITSDDIAAGEMNFAADTVNDACGRMKANGKTEYVYSVMQAHPSTSLVKVLFTGNSISKRVSRVTFNLNYKNNIMEELINWNRELNPAYLKELEEQSNASWDINKDSLRSYIDTTRSYLKLPRSKAYDDKLVRNLRIATHLLESAGDQDGASFVNEYWEEIDSGRVNGFGLSLQRIPKEVRHAALGHCHRYDFKASSFALLTSLALRIDPTLQVGALTDYIKHRNSIRKLIASEIGVSETRMKTVFTSIGFGADLKDNPYSSIRGKLGQDKYNKLIANNTFSLIKAQLDAVTATINKAYPDTGFDLLGRTYKQINPKDGKKRSKNQKLAWIYQCMESHALALLMADIPEDFKVLLQVHDCIYTEKKLSANVIADVKYKLSKAYPLLNFEHEEIIPIHDAKDHGRQEREQEAREAAHRQDIDKQEQAASVYTPTSSLLTDYEPTVEEFTRAQYEAKRKMQFVLDIARHQSGN